MLLLTALITWYANQGQNNPFSPSYTLSLIGKDENIFLTGSNHPGLSFWIPLSSLSDQVSIQGDTLFAVPDSHAVSAANALVTKKVFFLDTCLDGNRAFGSHIRCIGLSADLSDMHITRIPALAHGLGPVQIDRGNFSVLVWHYRWGEIREDIAFRHSEQYDIIIGVDWPQDAGELLREVMRPKELILIDKGSRNQRRLNIQQIGEFPFRLAISEKSGENTTVKFLRPE